MGEFIKSGREVVEAFFEEIRSIDGTDKKVVEKLLALYKKGKLSDTNIQNEMEQLLNEELREIDNGKDSKN